MGKKSAAPPPPDYAAAAEKTGASDAAAQTRADWANRPTINTPWGQESWQSSSAVDPSTGKPVTSWTQNTTLDPKAQAALDSQMAVDMGKSQLAEGSIGRMRDAYSQPFDWSNMQAHGQVPQAGGLQPTQPLNAQYLGQGPQTQAQNVGGAGQGIMAGLSGYGAVPDAGGDMGRQRIEQGYMDRLRPEHAQQQAGLEGKLANMGLTRGSAAWNKEAQRLGDQQSRQQFDAMDRAGAEQTRQFNMGLQGQGQQFNQALGAGNFQNAAQGQAFGQGMSQAGQNYAQQAGANSDNFARAQAAGAQNFGQQQAAGSYNFGQNQAAGEQNYNQGMQSANYANALRQQQIGEQQMQRAMPLNEMNAILTGAQVGMPTMPDFNASAKAGGVNYSGAARDQYSGAMDAYNAKQSQQQGMMSGLGGLASAGMMAF